MAGAHPRRKWIVLGVLALLAAFGWWFVDRQLEPARLTATVLKRLGDSLALDITFSGTPEYAFKPEPRLQVPDLVGARKDAEAKGRLQGAAGVGTAAVIAPIGRLSHQGREIKVAEMKADNPLMRAGAELEAIRSGKTADRHGWLMSI